jgi:hypothetical protein
MAVSIVDRRTTITEADNTTGWTNAGFGDQTLDFAEAPSAVAAAINEGTNPVYFTAGVSTDLSNRLVYVYGFNNAIQDAWDDAGGTFGPGFPLALLLGDGTNRIAFAMAGNNKKVFTHADGPTNWQSLVLDGSLTSSLNSVGLGYTVAGSFAALNESQITQFGCFFKTNSKALGGGYNVSVDIIRVGNDGLYIVGGSFGDPGVCTNIAAADRSTATGAAHGIFREYAPTAFGVQGPLTFGGNGSDSYFDDSGVVIVYEDRDIANGKYYFDIAGLSTTNNQFRLSDSTITRAGPDLTIRCSDNVNYLEFDSVSLVSLGGSVYLPHDAGIGRTHIINNCSFTECGLVHPGSVTFTNNNIVGSISSIAVLLDSEEGATGSANWSDLSFTSGGTGHAVGIATTGTYTFNNFTYDGYASSDGTTGNEAIFNYSEGEVTLNITGGQTPPSIYNFNTSTTNVVSTATVNINGLPNTVGLANSTEIRVFDRSQIDGNLGFTTTEFAGVGTENHTTSTYSFTVGLGATFDVRIVNLDYVPFFLSNQSADTNPTNIPVSLIIDRVYEDETPPSGE